MSKPTRRVDGGGPVLATLAQVYWKPAYKYTRVHWQRSRSDAEELTEAFFGSELTPATFAAFDPARERLRSFLRTGLDRFVSGGRVAPERSGGLAIRADFDAAERELAQAGSAFTSDPEQLFEAEWLRQLTAVATQRLRAELVAKRKREHLQVFELLQLSDVPPTYAAVAEQRGIAITDVTNRLSYARRAFRRVALELLREITAGDADFRAEADAVFGVGDLDAAQ